MDLGRLIDAAKQLLEGGGIDGLTDKVTELKDVAEGEGGILDKVQAGAETIQEQGGSPPSAG